MSRSDAISNPGQPAQPPAASGASAGPPHGPPPDGDARLRHGLTVAALSLLILVLLYEIFRELAPILRPLFVAVFLCYLIVPIHHWLVRRRIPSLVAYVIIVGALIAGMYTAGQLVYVGVSQFTRELQSNITTLESVVRDQRQKWEERWERFTSVFATQDEEEARDAEGEPPDRESLPGPPEERAGPGVPEDDAATQGTTTAPTATQPTATQPTATAATGAAPIGAVEPPDEGPPRPPLVTVEQINALTRANLATFLGTFMGFVTGFLVVAFYMIFLLIERAGFRQRIQNAFGHERAEQAMAVAHKINVAVARYIIVKTFISALIGGVTAFVLIMFEVNYAVLWGVITFFANFIPYVGSMAAVALPVALAFVQFHDHLQVPIFLAILLTVCQLLTGSYLEPRLMGERLGISPLMILLSLAFWGYLWGVPGMILSSPLVVTIKIILENIPPTRPIAQLIANVGAEQARGPRFEP